MQRRHERFTLFFDTINVHNGECHNVMSTRKDNYRAEDIGTPCEGSLREGLTGKVRAKVSVATGGQRTLRTLSEQNQRAGWNKHYFPLVSGC